jgi:hypothetical protein
MKVVKHLFWILSITTVLGGLFFSRDWHSRYGKPINGDAKSYYAYLPAIFIYQDPTFSFVDAIEMKYYPEDRSQFKNFMNEQKNGKSVNKTFPGLSILYAPFFFIAMAVAWIGGWDVDGYSLPFQVFIALSHIVYFFLGLRFLLAFFRTNKIRDEVSWLVFTAILVGTNCWYYIVYDHSVSHIYNFFLSAVFIWTMSEWIRTKKVQALGWMGVTLALLVITRPTNAIMLLFLPLFTELKRVELRSVFSAAYVQFKPLIRYVLLGCVILLIPFLLWKWQSDLWLVYSYKDEGFNFKEPHLLEFLFSYQKGWLLWSPILIFGLIFSFYYWFTVSLRALFYFLFPIGLVIYVLSSWWCWTYGDGFGQRPMIEYIPFIALGTAFFLNKIPKLNRAYLIVVSFSVISLIQGYQIRNSILIGGSTTKANYWSHFLQLKKDPPSVQIGKGWKLVSTYKNSELQRIDQQHPYSISAVSDTVSGIKHVIVRAKIGGMNGDKNLRLVVSNQDGSFYKDFFLSEALTVDEQIMEFTADSPPAEHQVYSLYCWNGDTESTATLSLLELKLYK